LGYYTFTSCSERLLTSPVPHNPYNTQIAKKRKERKRPVDIKKSPDYDESLLPSRDKQSPSYPISLIAGFSLLFLQETPSTVDHEEA
jgi:hypothetical protein